MSLSIELVNHYLRFIHDRPHSLFHKPSLLEQVRTGKIPATLLLAICGLGCRFSSDPTIRKLEPELFVQAVDQVQAHLEEVSLTSIQSCVLLAGLCAAQLKHASEALYFSMAVRMAQILKLPSTDPADDAILRETKKRVWSTLYMADRWCSAGMALPRQIDGNLNPKDLPIDEYAFHQPTFATTSHLTLHKQGLWAYMIMLAEIFGDIQDLNHRLVRDYLPAETIAHDVAVISSQLEDWERNLPSDVKMTEANLSHHKGRDLGGPFVALHLGYHHYSALLYFNFLDIQNTPSIWQQQCINRCQYHAHSYAWLLRTSRELGDCEAFYITVGHMAVVSSSVLIHVILFGEENQISVAKEGLISNFEALIELKGIWPGLSQWSYRLFTFQNMCLAASTSRTHKVDKWMVRFLLEHSLPLESKEPVDEPASVPLPHEGYGLSQDMLDRCRVTNEVLYNHHDASDATFDWSLPFIWPD